jgi:hypothetical protein
VKSLKTTTMKTTGITCVLVVLASTPMAMGYTFFDDFESYTLGDPSPTSAYPSPTWSEPPNYAYLPVTESANHTPAGSKSMLVNNNYGGTKRGETHVFGETLVPSDADPTTLDYWIYSGTGTSRKRGDVIVELSMGDVHAPMYGVVLAVPIPVLAWCKPYNDSVAFSYFNGRQWLDSGFVAAGGLWLNANMTVSTSTVDLSIERYGPYTNIGREYTGGFDRVSILYEGRSPAGNYWYSVDDISVQGVPEPATMSLLAIGGLAMLRRRKAG